MLRIPNARSFVMALYLTLAGCTGLLGTAPTNEAIPTSYAELIQGGNYQGVNIWLRQKGETLFEENSPNPNATLKAIELPGVNPRQAAGEITSRGYRSGNYSDLLVYGYLIAHDIVPQLPEGSEILAIGSAYPAPYTPYRMYGAYPAISFQSDGRHLESNTAQNDLVPARTFYLVATP